MDRGESEGHFQGHSPTLYPATGVSYGQFHSIPLPPPPALPILLRSSHTPPSASPLSNSLLRAFTVCGKP
ncbi:hypothetical protein E2C01_074859 [Portunus trituberculatus]|uniref:Uncharacterized protein n=1 Tax=Portunus trituberculatus TaxID=210409 RepID=A0A5B7IDC1_PORTR|nr:hypothetical protein [Portunus trituberculatus]